MNSEQYDIFIFPLSEEDGGGYMGIVPDLQGCMSDGETRAEAMANTEMALAEYLELHERTGRSIPAPGSAMERSREQYSSLLTAVRTLTVFAEETTEEVAALRVALDDALEHLVKAGWSTSPAYRAVKDASKKLAVQ